MKIPAQTANQALESPVTLTTFISQENNRNKSMGHIIPQFIHYVSPRHKRAIVGGFANSFCQPGETICWGIRKHSRGYVCCHPTRQVCNHGLTGRPQCDPSPLLAALVTNRKLGEKDFHESGINRHVASYI